MTDQNPPEKAERLEDTPASSSRREVIKKAAYAAPAMIALGVLLPYSKAHAFSSPPDPPGGMPSFGKEFPDHGE